MSSLSINAIALAAMIHFQAACALHASEPDFLQGEIATAAFAVEAGETVVATDDLTIVSDGDVVIEGLMIAEGNASIEIIADDVRVSGMIRAGHGEHRRGVLEAGGIGGSISIDAPVVELSSATIQAGSGGNAGPAGDGGHGGSVYFVNVDEITVDENTVIEGGKAGQAGHGINGFGDLARRGGNGGDGGGVHFVRRGPDGRVVEPVNDRVDGREGCLDGHGLKWWLPNGECAAVMSRAARAERRTGNEVTE